MARKSKASIRRGVIVAAVIASVLIYLAGVMSGLFAGKVTQTDTVQKLDALRQYVTVLDNTLKNEQLRASFSQSLNDTQRCEFDTLSMNNLVAQLQEYWKRLPFRIEDYEKNNPLTPQYLQLKQQYTQASIQTWITARNTYERCNTPIVPILYLYSRSCTTCVQQGEALDQVQRDTANTTHRAFVFTIDANATGLVVSGIPSYYNVTRTPAVIVNDHVLQGRVFNASEIEAEIGAGR